jgi:ADP-heptose:LPS heptosyltransferase
MAGKRVARICKGRSEKRALVSHGAVKAQSPLTSTLDRYLDVFTRLGFVLPSPLPFTSIFESLPSVEGLLPATLRPTTGSRWIGIAPFARYEGKTYPLEKMYEVVQLLAARPNTQVFLFGAGVEREQLLEWSAENPDKIYIPQGRTDFDKELILMSRLDVMVSMDSANMHLASLVGVRTVSIWGATHPYAGFLGYGQRMEDCVQHDVPCRPCSVFGNKPCRRAAADQYACMEAITPQEIIDRIDRIS